MSCPKKLSESPRTKVCVDKNIDKDVYSTTPSQLTKRFSKDPGTGHASLHLGCGLGGSDQRKHVRGKDTPGGSQKKGWF